MTIESWVADYLRSSGEEIIGEELEKIRLLLDLSTPVNSSSGLHYDYDEFIFGTDKYKRYTWHNNNSTSITITKHQHYE